MPNRKKQRYIIIRLARKNDNKEVIEEYSCINSEHGNLSLHYKPGQFSEQQTLITIDIFKNGICSEGWFYIDLITENDIITSLKKDHKQYELEDGLSHKINYRFEIQRYESDEGYFFQDFNNYIAVGF